MTEAGKRLLAAAHEALAFAKGEAAPGTYVVHAPPPTVDVKAIRGKMGMTQAEFGARFGFGKARIRDWEQHRTRPAASDRVLLVTIESDPSSVLRALERHETGRTAADGGPMSIADSGGYITAGTATASRKNAAKTPSAKAKARASAQKSAAG